ncbi:MAG: hypothetical protein ACR2JE_00890 [Acidobacteriaceae bacterium]
MQKTTKRWLGGVVVLLVCAWVGFVGYVDWAMHQPPQVFGHIMARMPMPAYFLFPFETMWTHARKGELKVGDTAPDLTVQSLDSGAPVKLGSLWNTSVGGTAVGGGSAGGGTPVVLVFGSYT